MLARICRLGWCELPFGVLSERDGGGMGFGDGRALLFCVEFEKAVYELDEWGFEKRLVVWSFELVCMRVFFARMFLIGMGFLGNVVLFW